LDQRDAHMAPTGRRRRARAFVEFAPQSRVEGKLQQMPDDFAVTGFCRAPAGHRPGRGRRPRGPAGRPEDLFVVLRLPADMQPLTAGKPRRRTAPIAGLAA
jgi:hypothetical protein